MLAVLLSPLASGGLGGEKEKLAVRSSLERSVDSPRAASAAQGRRNTGFHQ